MSPRPATERTSDDRAAEDGPRLLIVGASTRAAAHSALRGGLRPACVDLFGDSDLRAVAAVRHVADFPRGLVSAAASIPGDDCWMYTGGLENHPRIVAAISRTRRLLGNGPRAVARVRDPWWVAERLRAAGLPALDLRRRDAPPAPSDGAWLHKPRRGSGGRGIALWDGAVASLSSQSYFQRYISGTAYSAAFLADHEATQLLGITRQLVGLRDVHAPPFAWCGNVAPATVTDAVRGQVARAGRLLAREAGLRGLFGCDFIVEAGCPWITEVNPRYTGSMELLDHLHGTSLVAWHVQACTEQRAVLPEFYRPLEVPFGVRGKIVLYADCDLVIRPAGGLTIGPRDDRLPFAADLPAAGAIIPQGQPVCSLFARDRTEEHCLARLVRCARRFRERFLRPHAAAS